jgi:hypothetical protein
VVTIGQLLLLSGWSNGDGEVTATPAIKKVQKPVRNNEPEVLLPVVDDIAHVERADLGIVPISARARNTSYDTVCAEARSYTSRTNFVVTHDQQTALAYTESPAMAKKNRDADVPGSARPRGG